jgi:hypothetical protein
MNTTSITQIADVWRTDIRKTEQEITDLRSLFSILSVRWHWEVNRILREKRWYVSYAWHIEWELHRYYQIFREIIDQFPEKKQEEIMCIFASVYPGYPPKYMEMFYELAMYEKESKNI